MSLYDKEAVKSHVEELKKEGLPTTAGTFQDINQEKIDLLKVFSYACELGLMPRSIMGFSVEHYLSRELNNISYSTPKGDALSYLWDYISATKSIKDRWRYSGGRTGTRVPFGGSQNKKY